MNTFGVHEEITHEHLADIYVYLHCVYSHCGLGWRSRYNLDGPGIECQWQ